MRIFAISDIHGRRGKFEDALEHGRDYDLIVFAGDMEDLNIARKLRDNGIPSVLGNMDPITLAGDLGESCMHCKLRKFGDVWILGVNGKNEEEVKRMIGEVKSVENVILLTHLPPYGTRTDVSFLRTHIGSKTIRKVVEELSPMLCIHGHVHEARGTDKIGRTIIVNPGPAFKGYGASIEIGRSILVDLIEF